MLSSRPFTRIVLRSGLGCGLLLALLAGCDRQSSPPAQPQAGNSTAAGAPGVPATGIDRSHKGSRLPDLTFKDASGRELRLATLTGRPLIINLWATWCGPCVAELPTLDRLAAAKGASLKILTISQDMSEPGKVAAFLKDKGLGHLEPWLDPENAASGQYQVNTLPTTIYYDAQGREVWRLTGGHDWAGADTPALLEEAKAGK